MGALTSKPYAFTARPWELTSIESTDPFDAVGSTIIAFSREHNIIRILPHINNMINSEWITDKVRFFYDALSRRRIKYPFINFRGFFLKLHFKFFLQYFSLLSKKRSKELTYIHNLSSFHDSTFLLLMKENIFIYKNIFFSLGFEEERLNDDFNSSYLMNLSIFLIYIHIIRFYILFVQILGLEAPRIDLSLRIVG